MKKLLLTLILIFSIFSYLPGQISYSFKHIGVQEGLSNGFVLDIAIDNQGFIWSATEAGLNKLSVNENTQYKRNNSGLVSNELTSLYYDSKENVLWIASKQDGISLFNCHTQKFSSLTTEDGLISNAIIDLAGAEDGGIWILHTGGEIQHFDTEKREFTNYTQENTTNLVKGNRTCIDDRNGHLYIGHLGNGMSILDIKKKTVKRYCHQADNPMSLPGNNVRSIYIDHRKNIWVGTNHGLGLFNPQTETFTCFRHNPKDPYSLISDNIFCITEVNNGTLWIASDIGGISILDLQSYRETKSDSVRFSNITPANSKLSSPNIRALHQDSFGNVWVGNYCTGLDFIDKCQPNFHTLRYFNEKNNENILKRIYGIEADNNGRLWLGGENELTLCQDNKVMRTWDVSPYQKRSSSVIYIIKQSRDGQIWLGVNDEGVICYNPQKDTFKHLVLGQDYLDIHALYEDEKNNMWIGSEDGIFSCYMGKVEKEKKMNQQMDNSTIYAIMQDKLSRIWVGTLGGGVYIFNNEKKLMTHLTMMSGLHSNNINQIFRDTEGGIWIATYNGLAYIKNMNYLEEIEIYNERHGLKDCHIRAIQQDRSGNIWVSTYTGIACWNMHQQKFYNYDFHEGVPLGGFAESSAATASDGTIYFGSPNGVCYFNPQLLTYNQQISPIRLIACELVKEQIEGHTPEILVPNEKDIIHLSYEQNSFRLLFSISNYSQSGQVDYAYTMEGMEKVWYNIEEENSVTFHNVVPGEYTFKVKARLKNGDWDENNIIPLKIVIHPPFWFRWYAWLIYILITFCIIYLIIRSYKRKLLLENSLKLEKESLEMERKNRLYEKELNNERLRFYTNITHELRTPLTLILGPLEDLISDSHLHENYNRKIKMIHESALRLLNLINQILEFRKTETQNRRLTVAKGHIENLVTEIGLRYKELNRNEQVSFQIETASIEPIYFDTDIITTIISNLLSNAVKYTPKGIISLIVHQVEKDGNKYAEIIVADTGYGIDAQSLPHIFDPYYQVEGKHQASGTGIGLALVKSLTELHKGTLNVESHPNQGTIFSLRILTENSYPDALHKEMKDSLLQIADERIKEDEKLNTRPVLLIVEDNADIREYISDSFCEDYNVLTARNGKEGLEIAIRYTPNIVVSDIMMPEMNGIELCKAIKENMCTSHIPVILLTAKDSMQDKEEGYENGADSYLTKPFSAKLLKSRICNLLESRKKLAQKIITGDITAPCLLDNNLKELQLNKLDKEFLNKLTSLIEENLAEEKLDIAFMTNNMNMSHSAFYRKVKALTGLSANEFIRKIKLKNCMHLLLSGEYNITEAALMTGFNNMGYFRECFKEEFGMLPSEYLKSKKGNRNSRNI